MIKQLVELLPISSEDMAKYHDDLDLSGIVGLPIYVDRAKLERIVWPNCSDDFDLKVVAVRSDKKK